MYHHMLLSITSVKIANPIGMPYTWLYFNKILHAFRSQILSIVGAIEIQSFFGLRLIRDYHPSAK